VNRDKKETDKRRSKPHLPPPLAAEVSIKLLKIERHRKSSGITLLLSARFAMSVNKYRHIGLCIGRYMFTNCTDFLFGVTR